METVLIASFRLHNIIDHLNKKKAMQEPWAIIAPFNLGVAVLLLRRSPGQLAGLS